MTIFFYLGGPSSLPGSLKLIYFVKVIPFAKAQTRPLTKPINCFKKSPPPPLANLKQPFFPLFSLLFSLPPLYCHLFSSQKRKT